MIDVAPATVAVYSDIGCPWAHLCIHRLHRAIREAGVQARLAIDNRPFALEVINAKPTPKLTLDAEVAVLGALDPEAEWQMWQGELHEYPVTTLPAMEAVEAAKEQGRSKAAALDRALRVAFFGQSRCISMRHVILEVAGSVPELDTTRLAERLDSGAARSSLMAEIERSRDSDEVKGSPHVFIAGGDGMHNPGIEMEWEGEHGKGFPVVHSDDPSVYADIVRRSIARIEEAS